MIENHTYYMKMALSLAKKGMGKVSPNPCVGAVVVKEGNVIGKGYHEYYGGPHAEVNSLKNLTPQELGSATLYVTLEPCSHFGKTPPCADYIVKKGIKRVVIGILDRNPLVSGKGVKKLRESGVQVITGVLEKELETFYAPFFKFITKRLPFLTLKVAETLDGKNRIGGSKYLVCDKTLKFVHKLRYFSDAIMVGVNTVNTDNPYLNVRLYRKKPLKKVVLDFYGKIRADANIFQTPGEVYIFTCTGEFKHLKNVKNIEIVRVKGEDGFLDFPEILKKIGELNVVNLLVEGGSTLSFALLKERLVDRLILLISPYIIGGVKDIAFGGEGFKNIFESINLKDYTIRKSGQDLIIEKDFFENSL